MTNKRVTQKIVRGLVFGCLLTNSLQADVNTWTGTGVGDWFDDVQWSLGHYPTHSEDVVLNSGALVVLSNSTAALKSFTMNGTATLTFTNWTTALSAVDVTVNGGAIYAAGPFVNAAMSNRVQILCSNLTLKVNTAIEVSGRGYAGGGPVAARDGHGPGPGQAGAESSYHSTGASHGGAGGANLRYGTINHKYAKLLSYGSPREPTAPGSGGGTAIAAAWLGGNGGGAVRIVATGTVKIDGRISANGNNGVSHGGSGSGGSVWITCRTFEGSGNIYAFGGNSVAGGGGGRIAIHYDTAAQPAALGVRLDVKPGTASYGMGSPDPGTIWLPDDRFLSTTISKLSGQIVIPGFASWSPASLTINNCWVRFPTNGFALNVVGDMVVQGIDGRYDVGGTTYAVGFVNIHRPLSVTAPVLTVGGDLRLLTGGKLGVFSAMTPTNSLDHYGAWVQVAQDMYVDTNSWVYPYSHSTNGGSPRFSMKNLTVATNGGFNADSKGFGVKCDYYYYQHMGPGGGLGSASNLTGACYGGFGGDTNLVAQQRTYGSAMYPLDPGSAGGGFKHYSVPGAGGGAIRIEAEDRVDIEGTLTANGFRSYSYQTLNAVQHGSGGGGSGGGIYVACRVFGGHGTLSARGGDAWRGGGCGGGGRIAVWRTRDDFSGSLDVSGGWQNAATSYANYIPSEIPGASGTVYWGFIPPPGTLMILR